MTEPVVALTDQHLWPYEEPFTTWGQYSEGSLDLRVFDQDTYWIDIKQVPHLIADMSDEYVANVITSLLEHVDMYYANTLRRMHIQTLGDEALMPDGGFSAKHPEVAAALRTFTPGEWLKQTALMRALRRRQPT